MVSIRTALRLSALLVAAAVASPVSSWAQSVTRSGAGRINVEASSLPIGRVLRDMLAVAPIEALMIDPKVENHMVTAHLVGATPGEAINQILADSNLPFLIWGGASGPWRIFVGDKDAALRVAAGSALPASQAPAKAQRTEAQQAKAEASRAEDERNEARREERIAAKAMAERQAEAQPIMVMDDPNVPGGYSMVGESVTYNDPNFVPYKNRPEVVARRLATDVAQIP
jgi:hypothetical protein